MKRRSFLRRLAGTAAALSATGCSQISPTKKLKPIGVVPQRTFGKTGLMVSMLGFGSHLVKELIGKPRLRDSMIRYGFENGINTFDVYDHAGYKQFEPMGKSIREFRREILVALVAVAPTDRIQNEIDGALTTFHTDYIDLYRVQRVDDDRMRILEQSRDAGKVRKIGIVSHSGDVLMKHLDTYGDVLDFVMIVYNFHHHMGRPKDGEGWPPNSYEALIPRCGSMNLGILGIKPMGSDDMIAFARQKGYFGDSRGSAPQAMLRYVYDAPEIHCAMPAMNSMEELIADIQSSLKPQISKPELDMLADLSREAEALKGAYLRPHYRWLENWAGKREMDKRQV